jgi:hypothetical protein
VVGGGQASGAVTLTSAASSGGVTVDLSSQNPSLVSVPASIKIAAGSTQGTFSVSTKPKATSYSDVIKAETKSSTKSATLDVLGETIASFALKPASVSGGGTSQGTVVLKNPAPAGGWKINLASQNTSNISLPSSVTVPSGKSSITFEIKTTAYYQSFTSVITAQDEFSIETATLSVTSPSSFLIVNMGASSITYDAVHDRVLFTPLSQDGTLKVVDPDTGRIVKVVQLPAVGNYVTMTGDGKSLLIALSDNTVRIMDTGTFAIKETIPVPGNTSAVLLIGLPGTANSFTLCNDPWTYVFDGTKQRPNSAAIGIVQAISKDGIHFVGCDYRYSPNAYSVAKIDAKGFYGEVNGYGPVSPNLTDQFGYPIDGNGVMLDPNTALKIAVLPFVTSSNRELTAVPDGKSIVALSWSPNHAQVLNIVTRSSVGSFDLAPTDGGLGRLVYAGPHRIAYYNFGAISDPVVVIAKNPIIP